MDPIDAAYSAVLGVPSWSVRRGHGSFVTMEFGDPQLSVGDERSRVLQIEGVEPLTVKSRQAEVHGAWHLWIYGCLWRLAVDGVEVADSDSSDVAIARALSVLNGQALTAVQVDPSDGATRFEFDLGGTFTTRPAPPESDSDGPVEQWMLYQPDGQVLSIRGDGSFSVESASEVGSPAEWKRLGN